MKKTEASNNACNKQEEITTDFIVEIECEASEKINELEVRILAFSILLIATLAVSVGNLLTLILKK